MGKKGERVGGGGEEREKVGDSGKGLVIPLLTTVMPA